MRGKPWKYTRNNKNDIIWARLPILDITGTRKGKLKHRMDIPTESNCRMAPLKPLIDTSSQYIMNRDEYNDIDKERPRQNRVRAKIAIREITKHLLQNGILGN